MPSWIARASHWLGLLTQWAVIMMMAAMVGVVAVEVFMRYFGGSSLRFASELSRLLFVWIVFLGLPLAIAGGREVSIRLVPDLLAERSAARTVLSFGIAAAGIFLLTVVIVVNWGLVISNWHRPLNTMPGNAALFHLPVTIGPALAVYFIIVKLAGDLIDPPAQAAPEQAPR